MSRANLKRALKLGARVKLIGCNFPNRFLDVPAVVSHVASEYVTLEREGCKNSRLDLPRGKEVVEREGGIFEIAFDRGTSYEINLTYEVREPE